MNQSILEVRHLRTLVALRDSGSLVRAAQLLNLTQSALSHQIKLLEDRYGQPLFERKSVPPQFTAVGERLLALADAMLPQVEGAERDIARLVLGQGGQMRIAVECHTCFDWLMPAMDAFRTRARGGAGHRERLSRRPCGSAAPGPGRCGHRVGGRW